MLKFKTLFVKIFYPVANVDFFVCLFLHVSVYDAVTCRTEEVLISSNFLDWLGLGWSLLLIFSGPGVPQVDQSIFSWEMLHNHITDHT